MPAKFERARPTGVRSPNKSQGCMSGTRAEVLEQRHSLVLKYNRRRTKFCMVEGVDHGVCLIAADQRTINKLLLSCLRVVPVLVRPDAVMTFVDVVPWQTVTANSMIDVRGVFGDFRPPEFNAWGALPPPVIIRFPRR
jgi:hypothetical protein